MLRYIAKRNIHGLSHTPAHAPNLTMGTRSYIVRYYQQQATPREKEERDVGTWFRSWLTKVCSGSCHLTRRKIVSGHYVPRAFFMMPNFPAGPMKGRGTLPYIIAWAPAGRSVSTIVTDDPPRAKLCMGNPSVGALVNLRLDIPLESILVCVYMIFRRDDKVVFRFEPFCKHSFGIDANSDIFDKGFRGTDLGSPLEIQLQTPSLIRTMQIIYKMTRRSKLPPYFPRNSMLEKHSNL